MQIRYPNHYWNRKPLCGYINEADPTVMSMEIEAAANHGVNVFIFLTNIGMMDAPFMETTLDNGFLKADNVSKMKYYLMWVNHDVLNLWNARLARVNENNVIWIGKVGRQEFEKICCQKLQSMEFQLQILFQQIV
ncbi:hypothetical protein [Bacteroides bouchesdurhonensis]